MTGLTVEVVNLDEVFAALERAIGPRIYDAASFAASEEADLELGMTQELVPVASGALKATGRVEPGDFNANEVTVNIAYGDEVVNYAYSVHEDLEAVHPHGQAKYVESVVRGELANGNAARRMGATILNKLGL